MGENNYIFGFDIGIGSTGVAVISDDGNLVYDGTHVFNTAEEASESRKNRGARRNLSRKKWRRNQLLEAFDDFNVLSKQETSQNGYLCYTVNTDTIQRPLEKTVYHLRKKGLFEQISKRELLLCLYNMLHARGHFLMETIDFAKTNTISFDDFKEHFYTTVEEIIHISDNEKQNFENDILKPVFSGSIKRSNDIKKVCDNAKLTLEDDERVSLIEVLKLISGYKAKATNISNKLEYTKESFNVTDLKNDENELPVFLQSTVDLYDLMNVARIMSSHNYLCEVAVDKLDHFDEVAKDTHSDEYKNEVKNIKDHSSNGKHLRVVRNLENGYPNGLYVKEARAILRKQQEFYPEISDDFIEVCESIISARIPYYIGPLKNDAKNAWVTKNGKIKYSYAYSMKQADKPVDEYDSIEKWKKRMISHCTYLPEEYALPKGSFIAETFSILNELNILRAEDENDNTYYLTYDDKVKILDTLFMSGKEVKYSDVRDLLHIKNFGTRKQSNDNRKFNNKYTLYPRISKLIPSLKLDSVIDIFSENEKVKEIEEIILSINLYNEEKTKIDYFKDKKGYSQEVSKALSKLTSNSFYSYSEEFVLHQPMNERGDSMMSLLFEDNNRFYTNEQMTLISKAVDEEGNPLDFSANKYEKILKENGGKLNIDLLLEDGNPLIPISRPVIRGLNEAMKMYTELVKVYGVPKRVVIETARDLKDHSIIGTQSEKHFDQTKKLYDYLVEQFGGEKNFAKKTNVEEWEQIESYVNKNKVKIELYLRQNGVDLLTGEKININELEKYEVDHILPRGFGDDSLDDKMLISKLANAKKANRLPLQFIESGEQIGNHVVTSSEFIHRVENLYDMKLISQKKRDRLLLENDKDLETFINQNLVDTRYIIREFMSILNAYNKHHHYDTHVVSLRAAYTSLYRKTFNFDKNRGYGQQHHAHDAALIVVADKTLSTYYPHYDERNHRNDSGFSKTYRDFIQEMQSNDQAKKDSLKYFIRGMFRKAYGVSFSDSSSIISQIKRTVPFYSTKVEKNYKGKYFEATKLNKKMYKEDAVLSIVGVNDDKQVFSGVNCAAVDFYKYKDKKGNRKHLAVHIPKVIIDKDGNINQEKYIALIQKHYKVPELLDENGKLKTGYFRFRAFTNDIIYNTVANCPMLFNIGSITNKKLELKFINVFSYDDIYKNGLNIQNDLINVYDLKTKQNPDGVAFNDISKDVFISYVNRKYWNLSDKDPKLKSVSEKVEKDKNVYELSNHLSYLGLIINRVGTPPTVDGRCLLVAHNNIVKENENAQYVKLKYNILGLRFIQSPDGGLIIQSPKELPGAFTQIKKENFSWKICNDDIQ